MKCHAPRALWFAALFSARTALLTITAGLVQCAHAQTVSTGDVGTQADIKPKWEAGVAGVAIRVANYPASDEYQNFALPTPYFVYHGNVLRSDDEGSRLRRRLTPNLELSISGGGALPSDSSGSAARDGMPDLGFLLEAGPNLRLSYDGPTPESKIFVDLPVRAVVSLDDKSLNWRGAVFSPELSSQPRHFVDGRLTLRFSLGVDLASTALQRYFYDVTPRHARPGRPEYSASPGYLGASAGLVATYAVTRRVNLFLAPGFARYSGAANDGSPLFRSRHGYSAVTGFSWSFFQSRQAAAD